MSWRCGPLLLAAVALLATTMVVPAGAGPSTGAATVGDPVAPAGAPPATANVTYEIRIESDGDARFTVSTWFDLEDETDREAFREIADSFEAGEYSDLGLSAFREARAVASGRTAREMQIVAETRSRSPPAAIENGTGRLSVTFTWTNFAERPDNGTLAIGDAFRTDEGTWFSGLTANQSLLITPPDGYQVSSSTVPITNSSLRWEGPQTFEPETLSATFTGGSGPEPPPGFPWAVVVAVLAVVLVLAVGVVALLGSDRNWLDRARDAGTGEAGTEEPDAADPDRPEESAGTATRAEEAAADAELLSDEERVERLLDRNGGRMKQANIVKETGWSNAKVSQLLSAMEENERIDKLRIGRENLISFPDEDVTDAES